VLRPDPGDLILRANACAAAGKPLAALDSLSIAMRLRGSSPAVAQLTAAREALAAIPPDPAQQALRARIERRLRALDPLRG
jgi:hypothetical protein